MEITTLTGHFLGEKREEEKSSCKVVEDAVYLILVIRLERWLSWLKALAWKAGIR